MERNEHGVTVADVVKAYADGETKPDLLRRLSELPVLPEDWRGYFRKRLLNA
jgi:MOSC domain-containing protein YiiM